ncbi:MAG: GGDEF domain-containing protein [Proteobacteria bacterium]|nr:GGDEF domain-containing protein [Pseudomonadota bacterium]
MAGDETIITSSYSMGSGQHSSSKFNPCCLVQYNGDQLGKRFSVGKNISIAGRSPEATIFIDEPSVSRMHAKFFSSSEGKVTIEDLGSSNGTFLNDKPVKQKSPINNGDMIRLGAVLFKFFSSSNMDNLVHDKIYKMVTVDSGTGAFNKKYLQDTLSSEFKVAKTYNQDIAIIYYDLDFFKKVNDTYGHEAGDIILKQSVEHVNKLIRTQDVLCRFGGEEFVIILPSTSESTATELAERIRSSMAKKIFEIPQKTPKGRTIVPLKQTISLGVAGLRREMNDVRELLEIADNRLYLSKKNGRNRVTAA